MGTGHGAHHKNPLNGSSASHIDAELRGALEAIRNAKKSIARAEQRLREIPPEVMRKSPWIWEYQAPIEEAARIASNLKTAIDKALSVGAAKGRDQPKHEEAKNCGCSHAFHAHEPSGHCKSCACLIYSEPALNAPRCIVCGAYQFNTASGIVCPSGHGGADSIHCPNVKVGDIDCGDKDCDICTVARFARAGKIAAEEAIAEHDKKKPERRQGRTPKDF